MTTKKKNAVAIVFWTTLGVFVSVLTTLLLRNYRPQTTKVKALPIEVEKPSTLITISPEVDISSEISSDGTKKLTVKNTNSGNSEKSYELFVSEGLNENQVSVYKTDISIETSVTIPFNTWSPDNKYFFIYEGGHVKIFKALGEPFESGEQYLDLTDEFNKRNFPYVYDVATGWASPTLIIITTKNHEGEKGQSYWFEVPSKAIIPLGTQF